MPKPGDLTRSKANRSVKTPGGKVAVHRRKIYRTRGTCAISGAIMQLSRSANQERRIKSSRSSKRPNRPYGGYATAQSTRRAIIRRVRQEHK
jgi:large subunit ribosomal protein L34e